MSLGKFSEPVFGDGRLRFAASIDGFDVVLTVRPDGGGWSGLPDGTALIGAYDCVVDVSRDESEAVPEVVQTPRGRDFTARVPYFQARAGKYGGAARSCLERFLSFVRFSLGQPLIWGSGDSPPRVIESTTWLDPDGNEINPGIQVVTAGSIGERDPAWHSYPLTSASEAALRVALEKETVIPLHHVLLAQAKDAALQGDLRRAVMELAIASEVAVKQAFFAPDSAAGEAFEYFEDKGALRAGVLDLVSEPARRAFGESFKDYSGEQFERLDYLFRCRNKVVHRGELVFRDRSGNELSADRAVISAWLGAVRSLFAWLEAKAGLRGVA